VPGRSPCQGRSPRRDDHHAVPARGERDGQRAHHIAQAARLAPGRDLGRHKHDVQRPLGLLHARRPVAALRLPLRAPGRLRAPARAASAAPAQPGPLHSLLRTRQHRSAAPPSQPRPASPPAAAPVTAAFNPVTLLQAAALRRCATLFVLRQALGSCKHSGGPAQRRCAGWCLLAHRRPRTGCAVVARTPVGRGAAGGCLAGRRLRRARLAGAPGAGAGLGPDYGSATRSPRNPRHPAVFIPLRLLCTPGLHFQPQACVSRRRGCADHLPETRRWKSDLRPPAPLATCHFLAVGRPTLWQRSGAQKPSSEPPQWLQRTCRALRTTLGSPAVRAWWPARGQL